MTGSTSTTSSPSTVRTMRKTPWVAGCCGPTLKLTSIVSSWRSIVMFHRRVEKGISPPYHKWCGMIWGAHLSRPVPPNSYAAPFKVRYCNPIRQGRPYIASAGTFQLTALLQGFEGFLDEGLLVFRREALGPCFLARLLHDLRFLLGQGDLGRLLVDGGRGACRSRPCRGRIGPQEILLRLLDLCQRVGLEGGVG